MTSQRLNLTFQCIIFQQDNLELLHGEQTRGEKDFSKFLWDFSDKLGIYNCWKSTVEWKHFAYCGTFEFSQTRLRQRRQTKKNCPPSSTRSLLIGIWKNNTRRTNKPSNHKPSRSRSPWTYWGVGFSAGTWGFSAWRRWWSRRVLGERTRQSEMRRASHSFFFGKSSSPFARLTYGPFGANSARRTTRKPAPSNTWAAVAIHQGAR